MRTTAIPSVAIQQFQEIHVHSSVATEAAPNPGAFDDVGDLPAGGQNLQSFDKFTTFGRGKVQA